ncbi:MAG: OmpH family outer membrane protein [Verrucomicrobia bacterium]|nr:OmpH family outer membrane protein [Verrucomicrobiota bacterium]
MIRKLAFTLLSIMAVSAGAADLKFGVVDMSKAFSDFHKTKEAAEKFKVNLDKAQKEMNDRWSVYKNLMTDMQKLKKEASDPIMTQDARAKKGMEFEEKGKELRSLEQEIGEAQNRRNNQLKQEDMSIRKGIYDEILVVVKEKAKADGYDFIFDKSGMSLSTVPVLIYYKDAVDVTDLIIVELNKGAPAAAAAAATAPAAPAKEEKKP